MVLGYYGYTIGDEDISTAAGAQLPVLRFPIPPAGSVGAVVTPVQVGTVTISAADIAAGAAPELEGLGTNFSNRRVGAVNEPKLGTATDLAIQVGPVDIPFGSPSTVRPTPSPSTLNRFGSESGADYGRNILTNGQVQSGSVVLYNLGSNDDAAAGAVGSTLYEITATTISQVGTGGSATAPANVNRYADGLAVDNLTPGRNRAIASDFRTSDEVSLGNSSDPTKNNLYKVDLLTGQLSAPIALYSSANSANGTTPLPLNLNFDSGLAFSRISTSDPGGQRLVALLEDGKILAIQPTDSVGPTGITRYGYLDDFNASGNGIGDGRASAFLLGRADFAALSSLPAADYEGLAIVYEDSVTGA
ncbi:MAG: hypothetical protein KME21_08140 [Desmonostoc vinosum HA7617-LM4]|jgi:hypothetical protein|nr:hypothetical protein [Desmonostoc vinosum HA7617-LM4]